jgi:hypothetical protein
MLKVATSTVMWIGRTTVFVVGLAVILALVFGLASTASGANGGNFKLGQTNVATLITRLAGTQGANGTMFEVQNNNAGTDDTALSLKVQSGEPPMQVDSSTKVTNLNADQLDGLDSTNVLPDGDLPAGTTLRGRYDIFGKPTDPNDLTLGADGISYVYTFRSLPQAHFIPYGTTPPPQCPGMAGSPEAQPGHLCVYEQDRENIAPNSPNFYVQDTYGFGIWAAAANVGHARSYGTWAVTAPNAAQPASLQESSNAATPRLEP